MTIKIEITGPVTVHYGLSEEDREFFRASLTTLLNWRTTVDQVLVDLQAEVQENTTVVGSAITLLTGLKTALDNAIANNDMTAVAAIRDSIAQNNDALAAAVAANTPSAPAAP